MGLTKAQEAIWQKARSLGSGGQAVSLTDGMCAYLLCRIVADLGMGERFSELPRDVSPFFSDADGAALTVDLPDPKLLFGRLIQEVSDADTYFACLAALHKARLKYDRILRTQPFPTLEQVGPRGLLQYGKLRAEALVALLFWRKWFFDIDNRAAQETGYLFEPIIAHAIGGTPAPSSSSPVRRRRDPSRGRQVDCILDDRAHEFKIRVTIAASGQGRWQEELEFPADCRHSGFTPVLVCADGTPNAKLDALVRAFDEARGEVFVGDAAWGHLESVAGPTMSKFLESYVRTPLNDLLTKETGQLPDLHAALCGSSIDIVVAGQALRVPRALPDLDLIQQDAMPDDIDEDRL